MAETDLTGSLIHIETHIMVSYHARDAAATLPRDAVKLWRWLTTRTLSNVTSIAN